MQSMKRTLRNEQGFALFASFLMLLLLMSLGGASLVQSTIDLRATTHYRTGVQALMAAESGALHGLSSINQHGGVYNVKAEVVDQWSTTTSFLGPAPRTLPSDPKAGYSVTVEANAANPQDLGVIVSDGWAPLEARRVVALAVQRNALAGSPGAIYVFEDNPITFKPMGDKFTIDGNDHNSNGTIAISGVEVPAISTRNDTVNKSIVDSIVSADREDQFRGLGYDESNPDSPPSVLATGGPSIADVSRIINDILTKTPPCPAGAPSPDCVYLNDKAVFNASSTDFLNSLSSPETPAVIHLTSTTGVKVNGNLKGYGILIVDEPLDINGTMEFQGLVIARKGFANNKLNGNATVRGSIWTNAQNLEVGGSLIVDYSVQSLQFADRAGLGGGLGGNLPRPLSVVSWDAR